MPRRRKAKLEPEAQAFAQRDFHECVQALDAAQEEVDGAREIMDAAKELAKGKGFDVEAMDRVRKLKRKVDDGKVSIAAAQARLEAIQMYAEAIGLLDQGDLFREGRVTVTVEDGEGRPLN